MFGNKLLKMFVSKDSKLGETFQFTHHLNVNCVLYIVYITTCSAWFLLFSSIKKVFHQFL